MITAHIARNDSSHAVAFKVTSHGEGIVCAAVSMLVLNTVNSIEALTKADFNCDYNEKDGGYVCFELTTPRYENAGRDAGLLLDAMILGLRDVAVKHPQELTLTEINESE